MHDLEAIGMRGRERIELGLEDDRSLVAIGVDELEGAIRRPQRSLHDRDDGRDAAAAGEQHDGSGVSRNTKTPAGFITSRLNSMRSKSCVSLYTPSH